MPTCNSEGNYVLERTFFNCSALTNVDFGKGFVNNGDFYDTRWKSSFEGCSKLTTLDLKWLGYNRFSLYFNRTFANCSALENVYFNEALKVYVSQIETFENAGVSDFTYVKVE